MDAIFVNETQVTEIKFKSMMLCKKFCERRMEYIIKSLICFSILILIYIAELELIDKCFCCFMAILGLIEIFEVKEKKIKSVSKLKYNFFRDRIEIFNGLYKIKIDYLEINRIIKTKRYYFIEARDCSLALDTKGFKVGNGKELIEFIIKKVETEQMIRGEM